MQDLHDLLLVHHDAVGVGGVLVDDGVDLPHGLAAVLAHDVFGDEVHRAGPEQCVGRDQILDAVRRHVRQQPAHARGFKLEHPRGVAAAEQLEDPLVGVVEAIEIE